ncbi:uncharacterized protein DUF1080 [Mucilaginibacter yixingensis]|uniref:Uncharacterized protein DUF1080 n=1 Tax=Mucilaginibacter yixingensis TaxID=1295612 RepID=A0A2T5J622_9SPHI|nr:DUF1080 domain-containing protein [Mucilaginibacter yixingensis]PTQ93992.1 uncharacterized protein DUF1080 [Mucilaginibacter yixingensis]
MKSSKLGRKSSAVLLIAGSILFCWPAGAQPEKSPLNKSKQDNWKPDAGFESLFDGSTLNGWCYRDKTGEVLESFDGKTASSDGRYSAGNGILTVNYPKGAERLVQKSWTLRKFPKNFILKIEFRASKQADSGIFLRGPQLQCRDYVTVGPYTNLKNYHPQDWNQIIVTVKDNVAHCECNGEVLEDALKLPETGPIGLEGDRGQMEYRHIEIKEI